MNNIKKIYDCVTFFNELELLEMRLLIMNEYVDYFVIVEANRTFRGTEKPFYFEQEKERFNSYLHKIIYVKVEDMPIAIDKNDWSPDFFQRNCILRGLSQCNDNDLIIMSDVDEIPSPEVLKGLRKNKLPLSFYFKEQKRKRRNNRYIKWFFKIRILSAFSQIGNYPLVCQQDLYYYYLNCKSSGEWFGSIICKYKIFDNPQRIRDLRFKIPRIRNGGWHFSYLGGLEKVVLKLKNINEGDIANYDSVFLQKCINEGIDLFERKGKEYEYTFTDREHIGNNAIKDIAFKYPHLVSSLKNNSN